MDQFHRWQGLDVLAVLKGAATSIVVGLALAFGFGFFGFIVIFATGVSAETISSSIILPIFGFAIGLIPDLLGGYVAARDAGYAEVKHGLVTGLILLAYGVMAQVLFSESFTWSNGAYLLLIVPITALGGLVARLYD